MSIRNAIGGVVAALILYSATAYSEDFHLQKSLTGPSGKTVGPKFVFDETRTRFVYPNDKSLIVYFEWQAPLGDHTLVASWKGPDGRTLFISPDVKIESTTPIMASYWEFLIPPNSPSGIWTCEIKIDGEPAGSQVFELDVTRTEPAHLEPKKPTQPAPDQIYTEVSRSLVWVYALDKDGTRLDSSDGFVYRNGLVATSFEAIDSAAHLEVEFADGRRVKTDEIAACSRLEDWAVLKVPTGTVPALVMGDAGAVKVGEQLITFDVNANHVRQFGRFDITGRPMAKNGAPRILFSPEINPAASGGPLVDWKGHVVGILGASLTPGARFHHKTSVAIPSLFGSLTSLSGAIPISVLESAPVASTRTLAELADAHIFTRPLMPNRSFVWGTTYPPTSRKLGDQTMNATSEFRRNQDVGVETDWQKREKNGKGIVSAEVFDISNQIRGTGSPKKVSLNEQTTSRLVFSFPATNLEPGIYRVDVLWNDTAVWRTFFTIVE